jgi:hypothetical protein
MISCATVQMQLRGGKCETLQSSKLSGLWVIGCGRVGLKWDGPSKPDPYLPDSSELDPTKQTIFPICHSRRAPSPSPPSPTSRGTPWLSPRARRGRVPRKPTSTQPSLSTAMTMKTTPAAAGAPPRGRRKTRRKTPPRCLRFFSGSPRTLAAPRSTTTRTPTPPTLTMLPSLPRRPSRAASRPPLDLRSWICGAQAPALAMTTRTLPSSFIPPHARGEPPPALAGPPPAHSSVARVARLALASPSLAHSSAGPAARRAPGSQPPAHSSAGQGARRAPAGRSLAPSFATPAGAPVPMNLPLAAAGVSGPLSGLQRWSSQRSSGSHRL